MIDIVLYRYRIAGVYQGSRTKTGKDEESIKPQVMYECGVSLNLLILYLFYIFFIVFAATNMMLMTLTFDSSYPYHIQLTRKTLNLSSITPHIHMANVKLLSCILTSFIVKCIISMRNSKCYYVIYCCFPFLEIS